MNFFKDFKPEIKLFLIVAFVAVVISVVGILLLRELLPAPTPQQAIGNQQLTIDTSNWQTYRNEELGFEVKYPLDRMAKMRNEASVARDGAFYIFSNDHMNAEKRCKENLEALLNQGIDGFDYGSCEFGIFISVQARKEWESNYMVGRSYPLVESKYAIKLNRDYMAADLAVAVPLEIDNNRFVVFEAYDIYDGDRKSNDHEILEQILSTFRFVE